MTHTYSTLEVSADVWDEIAGRLKGTVHESAIEDDTIDMHGIGLVKSERKRASETPQEQIFPGKHGPIQADAAEIMRRIMRAITEQFPGWEVTLFLAERYPPAGANRDPRFNYASTANRQDMVAVLKAFIAKNEAVAPKIDRIADDPPTRTRQ